MAKDPMDQMARIEPSPLTEFVEAMEAVVGKGDWANAHDFFAVDVIYRVGSREPFLGVDGIKTYMEWQGTLVRWEGHEVRSMFARGNVAFFEVESHFLRLRDQVKLIVPCTDIYTFADDRIADWRVYADTSAFAG